MIWNIAWDLEFSTRYGLSGTCHAGLDLWVNKQKRDLRIACLSTKLRGLKTWFVIRMSQTLALLRNASRRVLVVQWVMRSDWCCLIASIYRNRIMFLRLCKRLSRAYCARNCADLVLLVGNCVASRCSTKMSHQFECQFQHRENFLQCRQPFSACVSPSVDHTGCRKENTKHWHRIASRSAATVWST